MNRTLFLLVLFVPLSLLPFVPVHGQDDAPASPGGEEVLTQEELEAMRDAIVPELEEIRGQEFRAVVPVATATKEEFREYAMEMAQRTTSPEELRAMGEVARLLGVVPPDMDVLDAYLEMVEGQVGGFYDPFGGTFWIMSTFTGDIARMFMAHELTHALDDQLYDIDGTLERLGGSSDAQFAFHAVVEGSGMSAMKRWTMQNLADLDLSAIQEAESLGLEAMEDAPPFLWKPLLAVYLRGASFLVRSENVMAGQMKPAANEDVDRAFREPPRSSEQVLHPAKYWDDEHRDEPVPVRLVRERLPEGWTVVDEDDLGELGYAMLFDPPGGRKGLMPNPMAVMGVKYTNDAATGWGGDRLVLLEKGDARLLHLASTWDTEEDAVEAEDALDAQRAHLEEAAAAVARIAAGEEGEPLRTGVHLSRTGARVDLTVSVGAEGLVPRASRWFEIGAE